MSVVFSLKYVCVPGACYVVCLSFLFFLRFFCFFLFGVLVACWCLDFAICFVFAFFCPGVRFAGGLKAGVLEFRLCGGFLL